MKANETTMIMFQLYSSDRILNKILLHDSLFQINIIRTKVSIACCRVSSLSTAAKVTNVGVSGNLHK